MQNIYLAKAEADFLAIEQRVRNILKKIGRDPSSISKATIKSFCKNARKLKVCELVQLFVFNMCGFHFFSDHVLSKLLAMHL